MRMNNESNLTDRRTFLAATAVTLAGIAANPAIAAKDTREAEKSIGQLLQHPDLEAVAIVMMERGKRIFQQFKGFASPAFRVPVDDTTLFNVGSIGKHVTAVAILRLAEQGRLSLDDPLGRHVSGLSADWSQPSIGSILSHTSGLPANFESQDLDRPFTREIVNEFSRSIPVIGRPGQAWVYSNVGYVLLGYVIENLTGQSYADHVTQKLFRANGLRDSRADDGEGFLPARAEPVQLVDGQFRRALQMSSDVSSVAAGGLVFSARDIPAWEQALSSGALVGKAGLEAMFRIVRLDNGRSTGYGLGWRILEGFLPDPVHFHTGSVPGYSAVHVRIPARDRSLIIMATGYGPMNGLGLEAADRLWGDVRTVSLPAIPDTEPDWTRLIANYVSGKAPAASLRLTPELNALPAEVAASTLFRLIPEWRDRFRGLPLIHDRRTETGRLRRYTIDLENVRLPLCVLHAADGAIARISP